MVNFIPVRQRKRVWTMVPNKFPRREDAIRRTPSRIGRLARGPPTELIKSLSLRGGGNGRRRVRPCRHRRCHRQGVVGPQSVGRSTSHALLIIEGEFIGLRKMHRLFLVCTMFALILGRVKKAFQQHGIVLRELQEQIQQPFVLICFFIPTSQ